MKPITSIAILMFVMGALPHLLADDQAVGSHAGAVPVNQGKALAEAHIEVEKCNKGQMTTKEFCAASYLRELTAAAKEYFEEDNARLSEISNLEKEIRSGEELLKQQQADFAQKQQSAHDAIESARDQIPSAEAEPVPQQPESQGGGGGGGSGAGGGGSGSQGTKVPEFAQMPESPGFQLPSAPTEVGGLPSFPGLSQNRERTAAPQFNNTSFPTGDLLKALQTSQQQQPDPKKPLDLSPFSIASGEGLKQLGNASTPGAIGPVGSAADLAGGLGGGGFGGGGQSPGLMGGGGGGGGGGAGGGGFGSVGEEGGSPPDEPSGIKAREMAVGTGGSGGSESSSGSGSAVAVDEATPSRMAQTALRAGETRDSRPDPRAKGAKTIFAALEVALGETIQSGAVQLRKVSSIRGSAKANRSLSSY